MHRRFNLLACLAVIGSLAFAAPAMAALEPATASVEMLDANQGCAAPANFLGYAVELRIFAVTENPALCDPQLLAATDLCLEPIPVLPGAFEPPPGMLLTNNCLRRSPPD